MLSFREFTLTEAQNKHIEHIEDFIFNDGMQGIDHATSIILTVANSLIGHAKRPINITTKFDGAPAVICGIDPENGRFFVGTKGVFAKTPKVNYTPEDVMRNHSGELADILITALKYLPELGITGIVQGDIMFTDSRKHKDTIDGVPHIVFQSNTIAYAVPTGTTLGNRIERAHLGIVFHTSYNGKSIRDLHASYKVPISSYNSTPNVWFRDASFTDVSGNATFTQDEFKEMFKLVREIRAMKRSMSPRFLNNIAVNDTYKVYVKQYINSNVRSGRFNLSSSSFLSYLTMLLDANIAKYKTQATKDRLVQEKKYVLGFFRKYRSAIDVSFDLYSKLIEAKVFMINKLQRIQDIGTFMKTSDGYRVTAPEGFVAVDHIGNVVKLVDRLEFSTANFNATKNWDK